jgi:F-type H+-transporting ATPase subunit delta
MAKLISRRYADAFFEVALEANKVDLFYDEADFLCKSFKSDEEFLSVIMHPDVPSEEKMTVFENVFKGKISEEFLSLFSLTLRKNREGELCDILETFMEKVLKYKNITTAYVSSAKALTNEQLLNIKEKLSANLNKQVNIEATTDESLIGGVKILVDGHVYDGTVKKQLNDLKESLLNMQLAQ